jgi:S-adenosylmethionine hydrolase
VFVAPDNGLLTHVLQSGGEARSLDLDRVPVAPVRRTFHNRDIIAPVGALLASGKLAPDGVGEVCDTPVELETFPKTCTPTSVEGVLVGEDRFGNLFTSISEADLPETEGEGFVVEFAGHCIPLMASYGQALPGKVLALFNVFGLLEVAIRNGSASEQLEWERGTSVVVRAVTD